MSKEPSLIQKLNEMSKAELVSYANLTYGLNVNSRASKHDLVENISRASQKFAGNSLIEIDAKVLKPGFARIKVNKTEVNRQGRPVIVGLNGRQYSLPVGVEITVPLPLVEILNNAVQYQYEPDPAQDNELVRREVHSYPFTTLEMAAPLPKVVIEKPQQEEATLEA